jgi:predicted Fe-Mo cluster-binding NifX family protein
MGARTIISSRFGPRAVEALGALGIDAVEAPEGITLGEAMEL